MAIRLTHRLLAILAIGSVATGCTVLREELRPTYDPQRVVPGVARSEIDQELGPPDSIVIGDNGETTAYYETSRISPAAKGAMRSRMECIDMFTIGIGELLNPFGLRNNEQKRFIVQYDRQSIARSISAYCLASDGSISERSPFKVTAETENRGWTCNKACDGL
jgi:hypothetical protein